MIFDERAFLADILDERERDDDKLLGCNDYYKWLFLVAKLLFSGRERVCVAEIGTYRGYSAYTFMRAAQEAGSYIYFFAIDNEAMDGPGSMGRVMERLRKLFPYYSIFDFVMDSREYRFDTDPKVSFKEDDIDLFYVDGDHSYESCRHDLRLAGEAINKEGVILVDDMKMDGVKRAVTEFVTETRKLCFEIPHFRGMAVLI